MRKYPRSQCDIIRAYSLPIAKSQKKKQNKSNNRESKELVP